LVATIAIVDDIVARRAEPFVRERIVQYLSERFHAHVEIDSFHLSLGNTLQGEWGIWGEGRGLRIWPPAEGGGLHLPYPQPPVQPLIQLAEFHFHAPLHYKSGEPIHIRQVRIKGLDIRIPPHSSMHRTTRAPSGTASAASPSRNSAKFIIDSVDCTDARLMLETDKPGKLPLEFAITRFRLKDVQSGAPMVFDAELENPKPPGAIHTTGVFGPWIVDDPGASPVQGNYTFNQADLSVFKGIAGILNSTGHYQGIIRNITVDGKTDTPDFQLSRSGHAMKLHTNFHALVDGTSGDTWLDPVDATLDSSHFTAKGHVVRVLKTGEDGRPHNIGHDIALTVNVDRARIEDFLRLATSSAVPILNGNIGMNAKLDIPPGTDPVSQRIELNGEFVLDNASFTSATVQKRIRELSLRGQGMPDLLKSAASEDVTSHVEGDFSLKGGVLTIPSVTYSVPGADIHLHGTYRSQGESLDFTGTARMQATISEMVGGWKGALLKPADRFFKKHNAGTEIPIYIAGPRDHPQFGYNAAGAGGTHPQRPNMQ